jgi:hypothetical protein
LAKQFIDGEATVIRNNTSLISDGEIKLIGLLNKRYSIGEYFVLYKNDAYILGTEEFNDFFIHQRISNHAKAKIYRKNESFICQTSQIKVLVNTLEAKIRRPTLLSFNLSTNQVSQIKQNSKDSTHIFFTTYDSNLVIGSLDVREDERIFDFLQLPYKVNTLTRKVVFTDTFHRVVSIDNYFVTISQGDFISFESVKNNHTIVLQEQQLN